MEANTDRVGNPLYSEEVIAFVKECNDYCGWIEELEVADPGDFIRDAMRHLAGVYREVTMVEQPEPLMDGGVEKHVTEQDWSGIFQKALQVLGQHNTYLRIADDDEFDRSDLVEHKISEDIADVYQDLKDFIMQFRQGLEEIMNDALWEVISNFEQYWGEKLLNALGALHRLHVKKIDLEDMEGEEYPPGGQTANPGRHGGDDGASGADTPTYDTSFFRKFQDQSGENNDF